MKKEIAIKTETMKIEIEKVIKDNKKNAKRTCTCCGCGGPSSGGGSSLC